MKQKKVSLWDEEDRNTFNLPQMVKAHLEKLHFPDFSDVFEVSPFVPNLTKENLEVPLKVSLPYMDPQWNTLNFA